MAFTSADLAEIESLIMELARGAKSVTFGDRSYTERDIAELTKLRDVVKQSVLATAGGISVTYGKFSKG